MFNLFSILNLIGAGMLLIIAFRLALSKVRAQILFSLFAFGKVGWMIFQVAYYYFLTNPLLFEVLSRFAVASITLATQGLLMFTLYVTKGEKLSKYIIIPLITAVVLLLILPTTFNLTNNQGTLTKDVDWSRASTYIILASTLSGFFTPSILFVLNGWKIKNKELRKKTIVVGVLLFINWLWGFSNEVLVRNIDITNIVEGLTAAPLVYLLARLIFGKEK